MTHGAATRAAPRGPRAGEWDDRFPTRPIPVGRHPVGVVHEGRHPRAAAGHPARLTILVATAVVLAAVSGALGYQTWTSASPAATSDAPRSGDRRGALGEADGAVPDGLSVFDDGFPAVAELDPGLLAALRRAATEAADDRVEFVVNSGWRSREYQDHLLDEAIAEYGSEEEAARWVATPDTSPHVSGDAVDIGPSAAAAWLAEHGADHGLCQIYRNEPWHYELRRDAVDDGCPRMYADPTHDPRMQE